MPGNGWLVRAASGEPTLLIRLTMPGNGWLVRVAQSNTLI